MSQPVSAPTQPIIKQDADYIFYELTRSICPECKQVIDAHILLRDNKVYMRKRCPQHGLFESLVYGDAHAYVNSAKFNKPGTIPLKYSTDIVAGCPHDCGLCPDHQQHVCVGIIEVNTACNMDCPLCFADAGAGYNLTLTEVEEILDHLVATEGRPRSSSIFWRRTHHPPRPHPHVKSSPSTRHSFHHDQHQRQTHCLRRQLCQPTGRTTARYLFPIRRLRFRNLPPHSQRARHTRRKTQSLRPIT